MCPRASFPDPPSYAQQQEHHAEYYDDDDMGDQAESYNVVDRSNVIARDIRSQSEYHMPRNSKPQPESINQRSASYNDESDLFSEITVCMSQVCVSLLFYKLS